MCALLQNKWMSEQTLLKWSIKAKAQGKNCKKFFTLLQIIRKYCSVQQLEMELKILFQLFSNFNCYLLFSGDENAS
jgi:hypothetical protein